MSIKPSVVYIKGVHDIADPNPSTAPDIGFPNIGLDKLFEGAAVKVNYYYSNEASSLQFVFTDKDIDGILEACNLPNDIKKYVHLTNLKYNEN